MHILSELGMYLSSQLTLCLLLFMSLISLSYAGVKVVIDTDQPEDNFVIQCKWYSDFLNLHGGSKLVNEKVFVLSSGKEKDCGWSLFGDGPSVNVMHPLYVSVEVCAYGPVCQSPYSKFDGNKVTIKPVSIEQHLGNLKSEYKGEELSNIVKGFCASHFSDFYFRSYKRAGKIRITEFKHAYTEPLKRFWKQAASIDHVGKGMADPDKAIAAYMEKVNE